MPQQRHTAATVGESVTMQQCYGPRTGIATTMMMMVTGAGARDWTFAPRHLPPLWLGFKVTGSGFALRLDY